jgi:hypothetical protein
MTREYEMQSFLEQTDFVGFLSHVQRELGDDFPDASAVLDRAMPALLGTGEGTLSPLV